SFIGSYKLGLGFTFDDTDKKGVANSLSEMDRLIGEDPRNAERIFPYLGGEELNDSPTHTHHRYAINFANFPLRREKTIGRIWNAAGEDQQTLWLRSGIVPEDYPEPVAADWPDLLDIVERKVKPERDKDNRDVRRKFWWRYAENTPALYAACTGRNSVFALSQTSKHLALAIIPTRTVFSHKLVVFPDDNCALVAIVQSTAHLEWMRFFGSSLEDRPVYTPSDCFETFPFPAGWETDAALEAAGREYYEARAALMVANTEGLTKTYNRFHDPTEDASGIVNLRRLHAALDHAVLAAYGWSDLVEAGRCACEFIPEYYDEPEQEGGDPVPKSIRYRWPDTTRDEVLARLLKLNAERAAAEGSQPAKQSAKGTGTKPPGRKSSRNTSGSAPPAQGELLDPPQPDLFG
ncbi:MAG: type IIL restriction-modification enzyme MmeI, partial [Limisphaerales bacterium]